MSTSEHLRVLYVEDNFDSFEMLRVMLGMSQIDVECAVNLSEALTRAGSEKFDLYLLDTGLPDGSGVGLCRTLRAADPAIPVLFYSGDARSEAVKLGLDAGADGYISKPHSDKLAATIIELVADRRDITTGSKYLPLLAASASSHGI